MKLYQLLTIFVILQASSINARTLEDVLKDFQPVFDEFSNNIGTLEGFAHSTGINQVAEIHQFRSIKNSEITQNLAQAMREIVDKIREIIAENDMQGHDDLIQHCFKAEQLAAKKMNENVYVRNGVCDIISNKKINDVEQFLSKLYEEPAKLRAALETTKKLCLENSQTPNDLQECLILNLYFVHKIQVDDFARNITVVTNESAELVSYSIEEIDACVSYIYNMLHNEKLSIIDIYRNCVVEAAGNLP